MNVYYLQYNCILQAAATIYEVNLQLLITDTYLFKEGEVFGCLTNRANEDADETAATAEHHEDEEEHRPHHVYPAIHINLGVKVTQGAYYEW